MLLKMMSEAAISHVFSSDRQHLLCRICLTFECRNLISFFDSQGSYFKRMVLCTEIQVDEGDGLPNGICTDCYRELDMIESFWAKFAYSNNILKKINSDLLNNINNVTENSDKNEVIDNVDMEAKENCTDDEKSELINNISDKSVILTDLDLKVNNPQKDISNSVSIPDEIKVECEYRNNGQCDCIVCSKKVDTKTKRTRRLKKSRDKMTSKENMNVTSDRSQQKFDCSECNYSTSRHESLVYHLRTHTGEKPFECDSCDRRFSQRGSLIYHRKTHSEKMYYTCAECGKQFKHKDQFERHKLVHVKEKKFSCSVCKKLLKSKISLDIHMNRHNNIKNYNCETCGATFVTNSELIMHAKGHAKERKFQCNICEFGSNTRANLENHMRRHSGERPYKCKFCDWAFVTCYELKAHGRKHTKDRNYPCPYCEQKLKSSSGLNRHVFRLHGKKFKWSNTADRRILK